MNKLMLNKKSIIITSINSPTEPLKQYAEWPEWNIIVVGDRKSPTDWKLGKTNYLSIKQQYKIYYLKEFAELLPENTYTRKMLGYIYAIKNGSQIIFETDDDNYPYKDAPKVIDNIINEETEKNCKYIKGRNRWVNIYKYFGAKHCWPRGFPLEIINTSDFKLTFGEKNSRSWSIVQFLADDDPDVDAIYRMTVNKSVKFINEPNVLLTKKSFCPFNSQATLWYPESFPLLFFPVGVPDRVTDILRSYIAQSCLKKMDKTVMFHHSIVYQVRNQHDLLKDFSEEIPLYLNAERWIESLNNCSGKDLYSLCRSAIEILISIEAIPEKNLNLYDKFIKIIT